MLEKASDFGQKSVTRRIWARNLVSIQSQWVFNNPNTYSVPRNLMGNPPKIPELERPLKTILRYRVSIWEAPLGSVITNTCFAHGLFWGVHIPNSVYGLGSIVFFWMALQFWGTDGPLNFGVSYRVLVNFINLYSVTGPNIFAIYNFVHWLTKRNLAFVSVLHNELI